MSSISRINEISSIFREKGVNLQEGWLQQCIQYLGDKLSIDELTRMVYGQIVFANLRDISCGILPVDIDSNSVSKLNGPCLLQVESMVNVSVGVEHRENKTGTHKLMLTDGKTNMIAIEQSTVDGVSNALPGTKILIKNVTVRRGVILLNSYNTFVLGGSISSDLETPETSLMPTKQSGDISERKDDELLQNNGYPSVLNNGYPPVTIRNHFAPSFPLNPVPAPTLDPSKVIPSVIPSSVPSIPAQIQRLSLVSNDKSDASRLSLVSRPVHIDAAPKVGKITQNQQFDSSNKDNLGRVEIEPIDYLDSNDQFLGTGPVQAFRSPSPQSFDNEKSYLMNDDFVTSRRKTPGTSRIAKEHVNIGYEENLVYDFDIPIENQNHYPDKRKLSPTCASTSQLLPSSSSLLNSNSGLEESRDSSKISLGSSSPLVRKLQLTNENDGAANNDVSKNMDDLDDFVPTPPDTQTDIFQYAIRNSIPRPPKLIVGFATGIKSFKVNITEKDLKDTTQDKNFLEPHFFVTVLFRQIHSSEEEHVLIHPQLAQSIVEVSPQQYEVLKKDFVKELCREHKDVSSSVAKTKFKSEYCSKFSNVKGSFVYEDYEYDNVNFPMNIPKPRKILISQNYSNPNSPAI